MCCQGLYLSGRQPAAAAARLGNSLQTDVLAINRNFVSEKETTPCRAHPPHMSSEPFLQGTHRRATAGHSSQRWPYQAEHWPTTQPHHPATCCVRQVKCLKKSGACCSCCALARQVSKLSRITMCRATKQTLHPHPPSHHSPAGNRPAGCVTEGQVQQLQAAAAHHAVAVVASSCAFCQGAAEAR